MTLKSTLQIALELKRSESYIHNLIKIFSLRPVSKAIRRKGVPALYCKEEFLEKYNKGAYFV